MPIKADINLNNEDAISYSGSLLNINNPSQNMNHSVTNLNAVVTNSDGVASRLNGGGGVGGGGHGTHTSKANAEKFTRFDGGEQQIIVSIPIPPFFLPMYFCNSTISFHTFATSSFVLKIHLR